MSKDSPGGDADRRRDAFDATLGTRALQHGFVTPDRLKEAIVEQARDLARRKEGVRPLGDILVAKGYLTPEQVRKLLLPASSAPAPDGTPFGKYRLLKELGRGGMGVVYEALEASLGRKVALKTMIVNPAADPDSARLDQERFLREAQLSAGLTKHPHIVTVYEVGVVEGRRYLAMELVEGRPMDEWWSDPGVTLRQEIDVLREAALAVHHAHEHGIIHRDLKPANILVDSGAKPHITDFGLAKMVGENLSVSLTGIGMVVGTPAYISPEQAQGLKSVDRRTDVYALGVILFEILTGRHPFQGNTAVEILMKASKNPVPSTTTLTKFRLPPAQVKGLDDICQKALAKSPADRYRDAKAFAADLARWLGGEEVRVAPPTRRTVRPVNRAGVVGGFVGGALLLGAAAFFHGSGPVPAPAPKVDRAADEERERLAAAGRAAEARAKAAESELNAIKGRVLRAAPARSPGALRPGLIGEYFGGANFDIPCLRKVDPAVSFQWEGGAPAWPDGPPEFCTIRWAGILRIPETAQYTIQVITGEGLRLFLSGEEICSRWVPQGGVVETAVQTLEKGDHPLLLEYLKPPGKAGLEFSCRKVNGAGEQPTSDLLFHDPAAFTPLAEKATPDRIDTKGLPGAQEGERLPILESAPGATVVLPWGREKGFLLWGKTKPGDRLKLQFESPEAGERTLILALGHSKNSGIVRIAVNGRELIRDFDLYSAANHFLESEFKRVPLRKGPNELEFTLTGSNPAAIEWRKGDGVGKMSIDYLRLR